jgi:transcriptional regulator with PAS, ATPase and Fis domain
MITDKQLPREVTLPPALQEVVMKGTASGDTLNLDEQERETILKALAQAHGNKKKAAEILGIHRPTLYSKLKRYEIKL